MSLELILSTGKTISLQNVGLKYKYSNDFKDCQAQVFGGEITYIDDSRQKVALKMFYQRITDDKGRDMSQNPNEEVKNHFEAFRFLEKQGFKVPSFYGILKYPESNKDDVLIMEDLHNRGVELIDEKLFYRGRRKKFRDKIERALNFSEIKRRKLVDSLKLSQLGVSMGNGDSIMYLYDESTNMADYVYCDVGGFERVKKDPMKLDDVYSRFETNYASKDEARKDWENVQEDPDFKLRELIVNQLLHESNRNIGICSQHLNLSRRIFSIDDHLDSISESLLQAKFNFYQLATTEIDGNRIFPNLNFEELRKSSKSLDLATLTLLETADSQISKEKIIPVRNSGFSFLEISLPERVETEIFSDFYNGGEKQSIRLNVSVPTYEIIQSGGRYERRFDVKDIRKADLIRGRIIKNKQGVSYTHEILDSLEPEKFHIGEIARNSVLWCEEYGIVHYFD